MPTISEGSSIFTQIVVFAVEPEKQQELVDVIVGEIERWVRFCPGFISANLHKRRDGKGVVNYAQWRTQAEWQTFTQNPECDVLREKIGRIVEVPSDDQSYEVYKAIEAPKTS